MRKERSQYWLYSSQKVVQAYEQSDLVKRIDEKNTIVLDEENVPTIDFQELSDGPDGDENISRSNFN